MELGEPPLIVGPRLMERLPDAVAHTAHDYQIIIEVGATAYAVNDVAALIVALVNFFSAHRADMRVTLPDTSPYLLPVFERATSQRKRSLSTRPVASQERYISRLL